MSAAAEAAARAGVDALRRGDARGARAGLEQAITLGMKPEPWFLLAQASRLMGDDEREKHALDKLLEGDPRHAGALVLRGDLAARHKDNRAATSFYSQALYVAASGLPIPDSIRAELPRVQAWLDSASRDYSAHLNQTLRNAGFGTPPPRLAEAIAILTGEAEVYLQQPTSFFYPGLPHTQFYEREQFDWAAEIEAAAVTIRSELEAFIADSEAAFRPYVERVEGRPNKAHSLLDDPRWSALHLWREGGPTEHAARFPATMKALEVAPMPVIKARSPSALFSMLRPGAHILPHNGMINTRLICHLPLIVPGDCALRVGNQTRAWDPGELTIFDDSIEHEAWNRSTETRIILLFEIWRPELSTEERAALTAMYEAIGLYDAE
ncbi:aspartyl/asparaginyl beta-hydroxylase domain-containing protein [Sphingomonas montanisoli]|nr:aspartyl/asparaginyl beta-hydroxylase domain-containing protein [Sphingomonas montanisoli]